jgi:hypothetical protein
VAVLQALSNSLQLYSDLLHGGNPVIDKADLRVLGNVPFTREFHEVYEASMRGVKRPWGSSRYYASVADFRPFGYDVRLHMYSLLTKESNHKLEIYDTGDKSLAEMRRLSASIFDADPDRLGLMRVDLCADVHGVDVGWFKRHTIIKSKQTNRELGGVLPYMTIRKGRAETLYAGMKPNQYRFYNKSAERMVRWRWTARQLARQVPGLTPTPYEVLYGHSPNAIITRVERQIAGRDLERLELTTLASLKKTPTLSPFEKVVFYEASTGEPTIEEHGFLRWTSGMHIQQMVRDHGIAATRGWMREKLGRNLYREWKHIEPFLHVPEQAIGLGSEGLLSAFQGSARKQIETTKEIAT